MSQNLQHSMLSTCIWPKLSHKIENYRLDAILENAVWFDRGWVENLCVSLSFIEFALTSIVELQLGTAGYTVRASLPYSRPYINTNEHLLPNVSPSDQLWSIIPTTDQLYRPQINHPNHWPAVPKNDKHSLTWISSDYNWSAVTDND